MNSVSSHLSSREQVLHAEADQVTLPAASARLVAVARFAPIRRLRLVSGELHEMRLRETFSGDSVRFTREA